MKAYLKANKNNQIGTSIVFNLVNNEIQDPNFSWEDNKTEFIYHHEWYDVIEVSCKGQQLVVYALKDGQENELEKELEKIRPSTKSTSRNTQTYIKFSCFEVNNLLFKLSPCAAQYEYNGYNSTRLLNGLSSVNIPPPKPFNLSI